MTRVADALTEVLTDLADESADLDALVADLPEAAWRIPTPAPGWSIAHQIAHLTWTDELALIAATEPDRFAPTAQRQRAEAAPSGLGDWAAAERARRPAVLLLSEWRSTRDRLHTALRGAAEGATGKLPWFGPPMSPTSMATARLMETWAHGQDVADALGRTRSPGPRLRHVAHLGVRTRDWAFRLRELDPPGEQFRVELDGPGGERWAWGPEDAAQRVTGSAVDFCLLVTQRRHRADLAVHADGPDADRWLDIAQSFAGAPGPGRPRRGPGRSR